ncbi:MAG TPA: DUF3052 domain-containing protein [Acidimicrobiales bacterium]|jgi:hypothetical protein|nr:DUF3052 domain-containing protein [Acidimicrobiales bacterium]
MSAGYSGTPLARKLGIKAGDTVEVLGAPAGLDLGGMPDAVTVRTALRGTADVIVAFQTRRAALERRVPKLLDVLDVNGGLWVAWPKKASKVATDITEDTVREVFLPLGLVDNKVCAIDDTWSGLRVVWRKENRPR